MSVQHSGHTEGLEVKYTLSAACAHKESFWGVAIFHKKNFSFVNCVRRKIK